MENTNLSAGNSTKTDEFPRYESQPTDLPFPSDSDDDGDDPELEDHMDYKVSRSFGVKADPVKEQVATIKMDAPYVPQQVHEETFNQ